ncbi:hypothetical protein PIB30_011498 [Stylosanthes scabra]|uniref:Uncharacterized protein n=1 Tax=Stylosanthes scabra TaxID=79078 RepID=A0ABU6S5Q0_9FABA|nr:hypothetical protein [Stylosanthes scabra]
MPARAANYRLSKGALKTLSPAYPTALPSPTKTDESLSTTTAYVGRSIVIDNHHQIDSSSSTSSSTGTVA